MCILDERDDQGVSQSFRLVVREMKEKKRKKRKDRILEMVGLD